MRTGKESSVMKTERDTVALHHTNPEVDHLTRFFSRQRRCIMKQTKPQPHFIVSLLALALHFGSVAAKKSSSSGIGVSVETNDDNTAKNVGIALGSLFASSVLFTLICGACGAFSECLDAHDEGREQEQKKPTYEQALLLAIIRAVMVKGPMDPSKYATICRVYRKMTNDTLPDDIEADVYLIVRGLYVISSFKQLAHILNSEQKEMLIKAMCTVFMADGDLERREAEFLATTGSELGMQNADVKEILQAVMKAEPSSHKKEEVLDETSISGDSDNQIAEDVA